MAAADLALARRVRDNLDARSWHRLTMDELAAAAGVSRMTLHRRGLTKAAVLDLLRELLADDFRAELWPALVAEGRAADRLRLALDGVARATERNLPVLVALEDRDRDEVFHEPGDEALTREAFTQPLERLLRDGLLDGSVDVDDPARTATVLFNLVGWTYRHLRLGHRWTPEAAAGAVVDVAVRGVTR